MAPELRFLSFGGRPVLRAATTVASAADARARWWRRSTADSPSSSANLAELHRAGLRAGATTARCVLGMLRPLTPAGLSDTVGGLASLLREPDAGRLRAAGPVAVATALALLFGWEAAVFAYVVPRLLLYPQLAWMSLLVEHRWFDPDPVTGPPIAVEAGRCLRLYPRNAPLSLLARGTWLPYGDLYHFAHSAHPAVRWNYLPALERSLHGPSYRPHSDWS